MDIRSAALVAGGSALGGLARYAAAAWLTRGPYPLGTLAVNLVGCFLIGAIATGGALGGWLTPSYRAFLVVGILGGFTTMSAFALESLDLASNESGGGALVYVAVTVVGCLLAAWAGRAAATMAWGG